MDHKPDCLRLRGGAGHARLQRNIPAPHLAPDPDFLVPRLLRPIIPVIQALNGNRFSNRQNRWIASLGPPRIQLNIHNTLWPRVVSKHQLPNMMSETEFQDLFFLNRQQMYQFRTAVVTPMLVQRTAQAQARGARSSLPHTLTQDSLACLFLGKLRLNHTDRVLASELGVSHKVAQKWILALRNFYFTTDHFIQRNQNLGIQANMNEILQQGIDATAGCPRTTAQYGHLQVHNTRLLVVIMDSRAVKIQQSRDAHLQKRSISTKINDNSVQKMTISAVDGIPMISFALMCSISPAGTDESNCEHLITIQENGGVAGGLRAFLESPLTNQVTLVLLLDQGFRNRGGYFQSCGHRIRDSRMVFFIVQKY